MTEVRCSVVVGRDAEVAAIRARLDAATRGDGGVTVVVGPAGVGKSRLVREALIGCDAVEAYGRAAEGAGATPYRPLSEALSALLRFQPMPLDEALEPWLSTISVLVPGLGVAAATTTTAATCAEGVVRLLGSQSRSATVVLVLEDVHWADPETLAAVEYLADNLRGLRVMCIVTVRDDAVSDGLAVMQRLHARRAVDLVRLRPLSTSEVLSMVRHCAPEADATVVDRIIGSCDGLPFLVEELLTSPDVPPSFASSVAGRLDGLDQSGRRIIGGAAVLGVHFDWRLLAAQTGCSNQEVDAALGQAVRLQLLSVDGDGFRFRHALTRDAVRQQLLPTEQSALAVAALGAVDTGSLDNDQLGLVLELAVQAGRLQQAGEIHAQLGSAALERGALVSAIDNLRRAVQLLDGDDANQAELALVRALSSAGRVDEAMSTGSRLLSVARSRRDGQLTVAAHLAMARAGAAAGQWMIAAEHLDAAHLQVGGRPIPAGLTVLDAEVALARGDAALATQLGVEVINDSAATDDELCQAYELIGRGHRQHDLGAAERAFSAELTTAESAGLDLWQLRALHELGTIDMFENGGIDRLLLARRLADNTGALGLRATLDVQLAASFLTRRDTAQALLCSRSAQDVAGAIGLVGLLAIARWFEAEVHMFSGRWKEMDSCTEAAVVADPANRLLAAWSWCGMRAIACLLREERAAAIENMATGQAMLEGLPPGAPAPFLTMWPLVLTVAGDDRAPLARATAAAASHLQVNRTNRGILALADAVALGRDGESDRAAALAGAALNDLAHDLLWGPMALRLAAEAALADSWGEPIRWLRRAEADLAHHGDGAMARACREIRELHRRGRVTSAPFTDREREVLELVSSGLANKEIAVRLHLSPRTVEKHVEALLRKTDLRSRTQLLAAAFEERSGTT
jgi:DNA-binding CsgD family transcriptional regulator